MGLALQQTYNPLTYYHRRYEADLDLASVSDAAKQVGKVTLATLPILSCHPLFVRPIQLAMGTVRAVQWTALLFTAPTNLELAICGGHAVFAITAIALTYFNHTAGVLVSAAQDVVLCMSSIGFAIQNGDYQLALNLTVYLFIDLTYLGFIYSGSIELSIASLAMQILYGLYTGLVIPAEFNFYERLANFGVTLLRVKQWNHALQTSRFREFFALKVF